MRAAVLVYMIAPNASWHSLLCLMREAGELLVEPLAFPLASLRTNGTSSQRPVAGKPVGSTAAIAVAPRVTRCIGEARKVNSSAFLMWPHGSNLLPLRGTTFAITITIAIGNGKGNPNFFTCAFAKDEGTNSLEIYKMANKDLAQDITNRIIHLLERGNLPAFKKLWTNGGEGYNYSTSKPYSGLNSLLTALHCQEHGYSHNAWLTFNQANKLGGKLIKGCGARALHLTSYRFVPKKGENGEDLGYPCLTSFIVYNVAEVEGITFDFGSGDTTPAIDLDSAAARIGVEVKFGYDQAAYHRSLDLIRMPSPSQFIDSTAFFAVYAHELIHSTGHKSRLARTFGEKFGDPDYAKEELVAELGAAMLCAKFGIDSHFEGHASYLESWLSVLKSDKRFIFRAASAAAKAVALLVGETEETSL